MASTRVTASGRSRTSHYVPRSMASRRLSTHPSSPCLSLTASRISAWPIPASRKRTLRSLCAALAAGSIKLDPGADRAEAKAKLLELPGIGPWTANYIAMRALGDPDVFLGSDLGVRHALTALNVSNTPASADQIAERWRPWRTYAVFHLWESLS